MEVILPASYPSPGVSAQLQCTLSGGPRASALLRRAGPTALICLQLAVMMITVELAHRLGQPPPAVHCLDPGTVNSKLLDKGWGMIGMDIKVRGCGAV